MQTCPWSAACLPWLGPHVFLVWLREGRHILCTQTAEAGPPRGTRQGNSSWCWWRIANVIQWRQTPGAMATDLPVLFSPTVFNFTDHQRNWDINFPDILRLWYIVNAKCTKTFPTRDLSRLTVLGTKTQIFFILHDSVMSRVRIVATYWLAGVHYFLITALFFLLL